MEMDSDCKKEPTLEDREDVELDEDDIIVAQLDGLEQFFEQLSTHATDNDNE